MNERHSIDLNLTDKEERENNEEIQMDTESKRLWNDIENCSSATIRLGILSQKPFAVTTNAANANAQKKTHV